MKKFAHVSDLTGKDIDNVDDVIHVSIKREGHGVKLGNGIYFGDTVFDIHESELPNLLKEIKFVKTVFPDVKTMFPSIKQAPSQEMVASFSALDGVK